MIRDDYTSLQTLPLLLAQFLTCATILSCAPSRPNYRDIEARGAITIHELVPSPDMTASNLTQIAWNNSSAWIHKYPTFREDEIIGLRESWTETRHRLHIQVSKDATHRLGKMPDRTEFLVLVGGRAIARVCVDLGSMGTSINGYIFDLRDEDQIEKLVVAVHNWQLTPLPRTRPARDR